jgi:hypothetical protein
MRSASVDFPWSMWAMMEKLRMREVSRSDRIYGCGESFATEHGAGAVQIAAVPLHD